MKPFSTPVKSPGQRLTVEKRQVQLAKCNQDEESLLSRPFRTTHALELIRARKKRLLKPRPFTEQPEVAAGLNDELPPAIKQIALQDDGLDIPAVLDRNRKLQAMADPKTPEKKRERRVIEKEK